MPWLLLLDSPGQTLELALNAIDLMPRGCALVAVQLRRSRAGQPPGGAVHHGCHHLQIAQQCGGRF